MSYIVIDTETSGLGKHDTILQIAYQRFGRDGTLNDPFSTYINPPFEYEIHEKAFEVNGLTKEFLLENGYIRSQTVSMLTRLCRFANDGYLFIGHQIAYDFRMIHQALKQYEMSTALIECTTFCTKENKAIRDFVQAVDINGRRKAPNLSELYKKLFNEQVQGAHDALADVQATARCYFELKKRGII